MMPSKKKKYNARFPAGRIKKIMQTDEDVGKVAQAVPVIISRALELFVESLLTKAVEITNGRNAKTLTPSHMKQCILSESRFDFLKDLVTNIPDVSASEDEIAPTNAGQIVPNYYQSVKKDRDRAPRGRGRGRGATKTNSSSRNCSTSSQSGVSPLTRRLTPPTTPVSSMPPLFYRETLPEATSNHETGWGAAVRPPVIQHTGPSFYKPKPSDSGDEEEDDEESNGYEIISSHTKPLLIDDDYDT